MYVCAEYVDAEERYKKYRRYIYNARQDMSKVPHSLTFSPVHLMACRVFFQPFSPAYRTLASSLTCVSSCLFAGLHPARHGPGHQGQPHPRHVPPPSLHDPMKTRLSFILLSVHMPPHTLFLVDDRVYALYLKLFLDGAGGWGHVSQRPAQHAPRLRDRHTRLGGVQPRHFGTSKRAIVHMGPGGGGAAGT